MFFAITYLQWTRKPTDSSFFLENVLRTLTYSELKGIANYLAFGPDISKIHPANTFPVGIDYGPQKLLQYFHWHRKQMECIRNQLCYKKNKNKFQIMVWKCPPRTKRSSCSGTGDRFRGIISSLVFAMIAKHVFLLSWPGTPYPFLTVVSPGAIDWRVPTHIDIESQEWGVLKESKYPELVWLKCPPGFSCPANVNSMGLAKSPSANVVKNVRANNVAAYKELNRVRKLVIMSTGTYGDILCQTAMWKNKYGPYNETIVKNLSFHVRRFLFRALFKPSPVTQAIIRNFIGPTATREGYLSIHARTGVDLGEKSLRFDKFDKSPSQVMANDILQCALQCERRPRFIYFSSDSTALKKDIREISSRYNIAVFSSDLPAVHIARYPTTGNFPLESMETWFSFINIFVDFFALANGTEILSNYSQFSGQARIMSRTALFRFFTYAMNKTICNDVTNVNV